ncbi:MAG: efflux transporter outer membrane subunit [Sedimentitalea sp.]
MRVIITISVAVVLSGCAQQSPITRDLTTNLPDKYARVSPVTAPNTAQLDWWTHFDDPVLSTLVQKGLSNNLSIAQARARLREAEANARRARGGILSGNAELNATKNRPGANTKGAELGLTLNLAGADYRRTQAAIDRLEASRIGTDDAMRLVLSEIAVTYLNLRFQQQILRTRQQDLASRRRTVSEVEKQVNAGVATRLDQLRTASLAAETRVELPQIEAEILRQRNRVSTLLGVPVGTLGINLEYPGRQPLPKQGIDLGIPADLLRARPDIRQAERLYAAAISDLEAAKAERYPSLSLSGVLSSPISGGPSSSSLVAGLVLPVFNQPALAAEVDATQARINQAYLQWRIAVLNAVEEVETAQAALRTNTTARNAAREVVAMNEEALLLSRRLLTSRGNITVLDVVDRERALSASRAALAQNTRDLAISYVQLRTALGQGHALTATPDS